MIVPKMFEKLIRCPVDASAVVEASPDARLRPAPLTSLGSASSDAVLAVGSVFVFAGAATVATCSGAAVVSVGVVAAGVVEAGSVGVVVADCTVVAGVVAGGSSGGVAGGVAGGVVLAPAAVATSLAK